MNEQGRSQGNRSASTPPPRPVSPAARPPSPSRAVAPTAPMPPASPLAKRATTLRLGGPQAVSPSSPKLESDADVTASVSSPSLPSEDEWSTPLEAKAPPPPIPLTPSPGAVAHASASASASPPAAPALPIAPAFASAPTAVLPAELRDGIEAAVRVAVEEAILPIRRWQREVEARLDRASASNISGRVTPLVTVAMPSSDDPFAPVTVLSGASGADAPGLLRPEGPPVNIAMPLELDGGRRHRTVGWALAMIVMVLLTAVISAMIVSQTRGS